LSCRKFHGRSRSPRGPAGALWPVRQNTSDGHRRGEADSRPQGIFLHGLGWDACLAGARDGADGVGDGSLPSIAEIAMASGLIRALEEKEIEALCERLNYDRPERTNRKVREALRTAIRWAERELMNWKLDRVDDAEHRALRKALVRYQEAWDLLG